MKHIYMLDGLCCANCAALMEEKIGWIKGVRAVSINLFSRKMTLDAEPDQIDEIRIQAEKIIRKIEPDVRIRKEAGRE